MLIFGEHGQNFMSDELFTDPDEAVSNKHLVEPSVLHGGRHGLGDHLKFGLELSTKIQKKYNYNSGHLASMHMLVLLRHFNKLLKTLT